MEGASSTINWDDDRCVEESDQLAAEHLMCLAQEIGYVETAPEAEFCVQEYEVKTEDFSEEVMEEVVTDDWVHDSGQERVEVPIEQLVANTVELKTEEDNDVALPTDQDEYTAMRPWPCDFCSRRFRKKAALMNHMVAHQNDRPFGCNLCGVRYIRRADLMNHLKVHAYIPIDDEDSSSLLYDMPSKSRRGRKKKKKPEEEDSSFENMTSARTMQWERKTPRRVAQSRVSPSPMTPPPPDTPSPPPPELIPSDPAKPFVCGHCGVGFAREKALKSHSRVHGGESPLECNICGELCWSKEALTNHKDRVHSNQSPEMFDDQNILYDEGEESDFSTPISESSDAESIMPDSPRRRDGPSVPELFCPHCGVAFQRADLLRRHVVAAHVYKKEQKHDQDDWNCEVCGETFADALQLLAHAGSHATPHRTKKRKPANGQYYNSNNSGKLFPCNECGKTFGSRSSQQIHVRIHTGERPYACRFCWKAFADGGTLRKHERIHTGEKPYACAVCPRAFNQRVVLREHIRSHHSAPENRKTASGFVCVVCQRSVTSSSELVQHLIQHCDANTALKRQPRVGPRKYKRRRKLKEDEMPVSTPTRRQKKSREPIEIKPEEDLEPEEPEPGAPFKCEMCDLEFTRREALLLHVPVHI